MYWQSCWGLLGAGKAGTRMVKFKGHDETLPF